MFSLFKKTEPKEEDLWKHFHGRGNSNDILTEKAKVLAAIIVDWSRTGALQLIEQLEKDAKDKKPNEKFSEIFLEAIILYVHFTDRIAFQLLETEQRDFFIDALMAEVIDILTEAQPTAEKKALFGSIVGDMYNERQVEYSKYKMAAAENEGLGGTLFWEFGKKVSSLIGFEQDAITTFQVQICIVGGLKFLQLPKLFEK